MERTIIISICFGLLMDSAAGQVPQAGCGIYYRYDATGNRIRREYKCPVATSAPELPRDIIVPPGRTMLLLQDKSADERKRPVTLYPNPTSDGFGIALAEQQKTATYQVIDMLGRVMATGRTEGPAHRQPTDGWPPGSYVVSVLLDGKRHSLRLILVK